MKWGLRFLGILDVITFLIFIKPKLFFLSETFNSTSFSILQKTNSLFDFLLLLMFLMSGILLLQQKSLGLILSFFLIPFRFSFLYFSLDFISHLAYLENYNQFIYSFFYQNYWFYFLLLTEIIRYSFSVYWYYKLTKP